ncbi:MAG: GIY-YIG nuclease family protein [Patescibacteria group bacterium]|nr:GIY-YIG nuclease family protein [Patescibacteria group bacterium]
MFYVYLLVSIKDSKGYIGSTSDLKRRLREHNSGEVPSTKPRRPFELVYYEAYRHEKDARLRESGLKLKSRAYAQLRRRLVNTLAASPNRSAD